MTFIIIAEGSHTIAAVHHNWKLRGVILDSLPRSVSPSADADLSRDSFKFLREASVYFHDVGPYLFDKATYDLNYTIKDPIVKYSPSGVLAQLEKEIDRAEFGHFVDTSKAQELFIQLRQHHMEPDTYNPHRIASVAAAVLARSKGFKEDTDQNPQAESFTDLVKSTYDEIVKDHPEFTDMLKRQQRQVRFGKVRRAILPWLIAVSVPESKQEQVYHNLKT